MQGFGKCDSDTLPDGPFTWNKTSEPRSFKGPVSYTSDIFACSQPNVVALTYDDGPYIYTAKLLDILKEYNFQATFFMTGNNNGKGQIDKGDIYPDLIKRMVAEGHQIASHTWSHYSLSNITSELRISQMVKNEMAINNIIGMWPTVSIPSFISIVAIHLIIC
jgi:peptidoglycan/xylan/chitin deacetylase (PgdA/CDA1 family)